MLRWRLTSTAMILAVLLGLLFLDFRYAPVSQGQIASGLWLVPLIATLVVLSTAELADLLVLDGARPRTGIAYCGSLSVVLAACMPIAWPLMGRVYPPDCPLGTAGWPLAALCLGLLLVLVAEMRSFAEPGQALGRTCLTMFCLTYVGLLSSYLVQLRLFHDHAWGMAALLSLLVVVKMSDVGAYTFGRLLGRHKLFPKLSPGKTVEGAVGGLLTAALVAWLFAWFLLPLLVGGESARGLVNPLAVLRWIAYGLVVAMFGIVGDVSISLLKRDVGRKDSGRWLPGLGGALDVADSIFMAAPPAFFCWVVGLVGPEAGG